MRGRHGDLLGRRGGCLLIRPASALVFVLWLAMPASLKAHSDLLEQIDQLDRQMEAQGASSELLMKRGDLYRRHQDYAAARQDFTAARELDPASTSVDFFLGRLQLETGEFEASSRSMSRYLETHPDHALAWSLLAEAELRLGQPVSAAGHFEQAIAHSASPSPELYRARVLSLLAAGQSFWTQAEDVLISGLDAFGPEVNLLGLAVDLALAEARFDDASARLNQLPGRLEKLPQWTQRRDWARCARPACAIEAAEALEAQTRDFVQPPVKRNQP
jgi:tetratricopeptide (TPR) repeat protein